MVIDSAPRCSRIKILYCIVKVQAVDESAIHNLVGVSLHNTKDKQNLVVRRSKVPFTAALQRSLLVAHTYQRFQREILAASSSL